MEERTREIVEGCAPLKVTLRQVMYRLVSEGVLPHTAPMCRRLSAQLAQARRRGRFDRPPRRCRPHAQCSKTSGEPVG
ncbi:hypothetical protein ACWGCW_12700 [Streptomyces sp. NPDC054933]